MVSHAVVAGAGIGGMAAALLLARTGVRVTLVERRAEPGEAGAGILLQPNGLAVLGGLGLAGALERNGHQMRATAVRTPAGVPLVTMHVPRFGPGLDHVLALRRSTLYGVLFDAVAAEFGIACRLDTEVRAADPSGRVDLAGDPTPVTADLVVGADGMHSTVRAAGDFGAAVTSTRRRYLRALVPRPDGPALEGEYWTSLGLFGGAPVDDRTLYFYASCTARPVARALAAGDLDRLARVWADVLPPAGSAFGALGGTDELLVNDVLRVDCRRWHDGRLVLLGDAAHAMAPTVGQGANSALVDAAVLARELTRDHHPADADADVAAALDRYGRRRMRPVRRVQNRADLLARMAELDSAGLRRGRDAALRAVAGMPGAGERTVRDLQQEEPAALRRIVAGLRPAGAR